MSIEAEARALLNNEAFVAALDAARAQSIAAAMACDVRDDEGRRRYLEAARIVARVAGHLNALVQASKTEWIPQPFDPERSFVKILWTGSETGGWAVLLKWKKGFVAPQHKHLSASHTFILSGKLKVRDGILNAGDYIYEPNGMLHGATTALEDTEYLFISTGAVETHDHGSA